MTTAKKKKTIKKKKYTLNEFQAWLTGIEEIQPDDWHPTSDQWRLIRERMNGIIPDVEIVEREIEIPVPVPVPVQPPFGPGQATPAAPVQMPTHMVPEPAPTAPVVTHDISPAAAAMLRGEMPKDEAVVQGQPTHKLPVDSTIGTDNPGKPYESTFI
jgi:hypothetical protein